MTFVKGQSGNPGGRPVYKTKTGKSLSDLAREHTEEAVKTLVKIMKDDAQPAAARVAAADKILNRGWGQAPQTIAITDDREPLDLILLPFSETCSVFLDKNQWMRVLNNLIKNAMQAVPAERKGKVQVSLETDRIYKKARLSIQDNGCGISEEQQKKIFVPYFTSKTSGSGIGLAMCKNIVEAANGHIWFETQLDEGTTFFVEFPLEEFF